MPKCFRPIDLSLLSLLLQVSSPVLPTPLEQCFWPPVLIVTFGDGMVSFVESNTNERWLSIFVGLRHGAGFGQPGDRWHGFLSSIKHRRRLALIFVGLRCGAGSSGFVQPVDRWHSFFRRIKHRRIFAVVFIGLRYGADSSGFGQPGNRWHGFFRSIEQRRRLALVFVGLVHGERLIGFGQPRTP